MNELTETRRPRVSFGGLRRRALACLLLAGCGGHTYTTTPVDLPQARQTLQGALSAWKQGSRIDDMSRQTPPVLVQDVDWMGGLTLVEFSLEGEGNEHDGTLVQPVRLTLREDSGATFEKQVVYQVTTTPGLTMQRDLLAEDSP